MHVTRLSLLLSDPELHAAIDNGAYQRQERGDGGGRMVLGLCALMELTALRCLGLPGLRLGDGWHLSVARVHRRILGENAPLLARLTSARPEQQLRTSSRRLYLIHCCFA